MKRRGTIAILFVLAALASMPTGAGAACRGQGNAGAPATAQERTMLCLVNQARKQRGLTPLAAPGSLARAAARKSGDILRCDQFSHEACGRDTEFWPDRFGYRGCIGENIAYAGGRAATPRGIFRLWMNSRGHRENILRSSYDDIGIGLKVGEIDGMRGAHVWTQQFGIRGC